MRSIVAGLRARSLIGAVALLVLAEALHATRGHYKVNRILWVTLLLGLFAGSAFRPTFALRRRLSVLLLWFAGLLAFDHRLLYAASPGLLPALLWALFGLAVLTVLLIFPRAPRKRSGLGILVLMTLGAIAARALVLLISEEPHIDVFHTARRAAEHLLAGRNPYAQSYQDIYAGRFDYAPGMVYWPGALLPETLAHGLLGDIRYAFILAELIAAASIAGLCRRAGHDELTAALSGVVWLLFPVSLFVLEQAWIDPLLLAGLLSALWAIRSDRPILAGTALGFALAAKQYGLLPVVLIIAAFPLARSRSALGGMLAVFGLLMAPFALADPAAFWSATISTPLSQAMRPDAFTWVALLFRETGARWPGALSAVLYLGVMAMFTVRLIKSKRASVSGCCHAIVAVYSMVFLLGKQAFCNYYALLAGVLLACICTEDAESLELSDSDR